MPHSFSSGIANFQKNVVHQKTTGEAKGQYKNSLISGGSQKQRPNSSKPLGSVNEFSSGLDLNAMMQEQRPGTSGGGARPASPGTTQSKCLFFSVNNLEFM